jgi:hypothetical protein
MKNVLRIAICATIVMLGALSAKAAVVQNVPLPLPSPDAQNVPLPLPSPDAQ